MTAPPPRASGSMPLMVTPEVDGNVWRFIYFWFGWLLDPDTRRLSGTRLAALIILYANNHDIETAHGSAGSLNIWNVCVYLIVAALLYGKDVFLIISQSIASRVPRLPEGGNG